MATILNRATDLTENQALSSSNFTITESSDPRLTDSPTLCSFYFNFYSASVLGHLIKFVLL
jgi:hypothetical protein